MSCAACFCYSLEWVFVGEAKMPTSDWNFPSRRQWLGFNKTWQKMWLGRRFGKNRTCGTGGFLFSLEPLKVRWMKKSPQNEHGDFWSLRGCVPVVGFGRCFRGTFPDWWCLHCVKRPNAFQETSEVFFVETPRDVSYITQGLLVVTTSPSWPMVWPWNTWSLETSP